MQPSDDEPRPKRSKHVTEEKTEQKPLTIWKPSWSAPADETKLLTRKFEDLDVNEQWSVTERDIQDRRVAEELQKDMKELREEYMWLSSIRSRLRQFGDDRDRYLKETKDDKAAARLMTMRSINELELQIELAKLKVDNAQETIAHMERTRQKYKHVDARPPLKTERLMHILYVGIDDDGIVLRAADAEADLNLSEERELDFDSNVEEREDGKEIVVRGREYYGNLKVELHGKRVSKGAFISDFTSDAVFEVMHKKIERLNTKAHEQPSVKLDGILYDIALLCDYQQPNSPTVGWPYRFTDADRDVLDITLGRPESLNKFLHLFLKTSSVRSFAPTTLGPGVLLFYRTVEKTLTKPYADDQLEGVKLYGELNNLMEEMEKMAYDEAFPVLFRMRNAVLYERMRRVKRDMEDNPWHAQAIYKDFVAQFTEFNVGAQSAWKRTILKGNLLFRPSGKHDQNHFSLFRELFCDPVPQGLKEFAESILLRYVASCEQKPLPSAKAVYRVSPGKHYLTGKDKSNGRFDVFLPKGNMTLNSMTCDIAMAMSHSEYWRQRVWFCSSESEYPDIHSANQWEEDMDEEERGWFTIYERNFIRLLYQVFLYATRPSALYSPVYTASNLDDEGFFAFPFGWVEFEVEDDPDDPDDPEITGYTIEINKDDAEKKDKEFIKWFLQQVTRQLDDLDKFDVKEFDGAHGEGKYDAGQAAYHIYRRHPERKLVQFRMALGSGRLNDRVQLPLRSKTAGITNTILDMMSGKAAKDIQCVCGRDGEFLCSRCRAGPFCSKCTAWSKHEKTHF